MTNEDFYNLDLGTYLLKDDIYPYELKKFKRSELDEDIKTDENMYSISCNIDKSYFCLFEDVNHINQKIIIANMSAGGLHIHSEISNYQLKKLKVIRKYKK